MDGGRDKTFRSEGSKQWGSLLLSSNCRSNGNAADANFLVGGLNPGRLTVGGGGAAVFTGPGFKPPTKKIWSTALPFGHCLVRGGRSPHCLGPRLPLTENPNCVFLCDLLLAWLRD